MKAPLVTSHPIRVLLADSNQTQSHLLASALRRQSAFRVAGCGAGLSECLKALECIDIDVVLLGHGVAGNGPRCEALRVLHTAYPNLGLILLLDSYDRDLVVNALRSGARGLFCQTQQPFKALCRCIQCVYRGQIWANSEQLQYVLDALILSPCMHVTNNQGEGLLTPREEQVVGLVAEGASNREIAMQLNVKENTVKKSLLRIYDKLGVSNRVELVLYALTRHSGNPAHSASPTIAPRAAKTRPEPAPPIAERCASASEKKNSPPPAHVS